MNRSVVFVSLLLIPVFAGCLSDPSSTGDPGGDETAPADPGAIAWPAPYVFEGCVQVAAVIYFDIERAWDHLPPGYEPTDGGNLGGLTLGAVETGRAALNIGGFDCDYLDTDDGPGAWFWASIDIKPPNVGNTTSPSSHDVYDILYVTPLDGQADLLGRAGLPVLKGEVIQEATLMSGGATGVVTVNDDQGEILHLEVATAEASPVEPTGASWYQHEGGVTVTDLDGRPGSSLHLGSVTACTLAEGSVLADLLGSTDCTTSSPILGGIFTEYAVDAKIDFLEGAMAET